MISETIPAIGALTAPEKMLLASELWAQLAEGDTEIPLTREQIAELDRRMEHYRRHPHEVTTWEEIKSRLLDRRNAPSPAA
jgi:putative addiction module component (TIGR02574 family)